MKPNLIESDTKYFFKTTLQKCMVTKQTYYTILFNTSLFVIFVISLSIFLYFQYKGKITVEDKKEKDNKKFQYIIEKIQSYQIAKKIAQQELITGLPYWENEYHLLNKKIV